MFNPIRLIVAGLFLVQQMVHASPLGLSAKEATETNLVIYPDHRALVTQGFSLPGSATPEIDLVGLPQNLDPLSLHVVVDSGSVKYLVWKDNTFNKNDIYPALIGQELTLYGGGLEEFTGVLEAYRDGFLLFRAKNKQYLVKANAPDLQLEIPSILFKPEALRSKLSIRLPQTKGARRLVVSYIVPGLSYRMHYRMLIDKHRDEASIEQVAQLTNELHYSFPRARVALASGVAGQKVAKLFNAQIARATGFDGQTEGFSTMIFTKLKDPVLVPSHAQVKVSLNRLGPWPIEKTYQVHLEFRAGYQNPIYPQRYVSWVAPQLIPAGMLELFEKNGPQEPARWTGSDYLKSYATGTKVVTALGSSYLLPVYIEKKASKLGEKTLTESWSLLVENHGEERARLKITETDPNLLTLAGPGQLQGNSLILEVAPGKSKKVALEAVYVLRR